MNLKKLLYLFALMNVWVSCSSDPVVVECPNGETRVNGKCESQQVECSQETSCQSGDGCCPEGCKGSDSDCRDSSTCGNKKIDQGETCDIAILSGQDGACPTLQTCQTKTDDVCQPYRIVGSGCHQVCKQMEKITLCRNNDGCCPDGCAGTGLDNDCPSLEVPVGAECSDNQSCGLNGFCIKKTSGSVFKGGYCTKQCSEDSDCPTGAKCTTLDDASRICAKQCGNDGMCRTPDYYCAQTLITGAFQPGACLPKNPPCQDESECPEHMKCAQPPTETKNVCVEYGFGNKAIGDTCERVSECGHGFDAQCIQIPGSGKSVCSQRCYQGRTTCPQGTICSSLGDLKETFCLKSCQDDSQCSSEETGLRCLPAISGSSEKVCKNVLSPVGGRCEYDRECSVEKCLPEKNTNFPGGYCTMRCSKRIPCPEGSACTRLSDDPNDPDLTCMQECTSTSDCREGYKCIDTGRPKGACWK